MTEPTEERLTRVDYWVLLDATSALTREVGEVLAPGTLLGHSATQPGEPEYTRGWCRVLHVVPHADGGIAVHLFPDVLRLPNWR